MLFTRFYLAYRFVFTLFFCTLIVPLFAQQDCLLRKDEDSIKVFTCQSDESRFKIIKASFSVNTTPSKLVSFVLNIDDYNQWQYNTVNQKILKKLSDWEIIYYVEVEAPWPISNRDMIIHLTISQNQKTKVITITANGEPDFMPYKDGLVRVPMSKSTWIVTPINSNKLSVVYTIEIDPGGAVPAWMVNMVSAEAPYISFKNLRENINLRTEHK